MVKAFSSARKFLQIVFILRPGLIIRSRLQIDVLSEISKRQFYKKRKLLKPTSVS